MELKLFLNQMSADARTDFARRCETTVGHLKNVMYGVRPCAPELAVSIERESGNTVTRRHDLRPHDWWRIWPELAGAEGVPPRRNQTSHAAGAGDKPRPPSRRDRERPGDVFERREPQRFQERPDPRRAPRGRR